MEGAGDLPGERAQAGSGRLAWRKAGREKGRKNVAPYQFPMIGGASALLRDPHTEARQAALRVLQAQVEVVEAAAAAGGSLYVCLPGRMDRKP